MIKGEWEVLEKCINQDTKERLYPGDIIFELSEAETGRLLAFNYIKVRSKMKVMNDKIKAKILRQDREKREEKKRYETTEDKNYYETRKEKNVGSNY